MIKSSKILLFCLLIVAPVLNAQNDAVSYTAKSVLSSGKWFRIAVTRDGIYRIDYSVLRQAGLDEPSKPRIFGNNSGQLSYINDGSGADDLMEIPVFFNNGTDGIFGDGDNIWFYAQGTGRWKINKQTGKYDYSQHNYSDTAFYFITSGGQGKPIKQTDGISSVPTYISTGSDALFIHEKEQVNLLKSGRTWLEPVSEMAVNPGFSDLQTEELLYFRLRVAARSSSSSSFRFYDGSVLRKSINLQSVDYNDIAGTYYQLADSSGYIPVTSQSPQFSIAFVNNGLSSATGYLDRIILAGRKNNVYHGSALQITDSRSIAPGRVTKFSIISAGTSAHIWDISDPFNVSEISYNESGEEISFSAKTDSLRTFLIFKPGDALPASISRTAVRNQDLHSQGSSDMIIITHPLFKKYAEKLAELHSKIDGLNTTIVTPDEIYNEFSGGIRDICGLRNFVRMKYLRQKGTKTPLKYLLLFGDGSVDNRTLPPDNPGFIPTYQSANSNIVTSSFTSDDFYGLLDNGEGEATGTEDIGIGRIPVDDTIQAGIVVEKIRKYSSESNNGDWKNIICMTADDEDGNTHLSDAESLSALLKDSVPEYNVNKIYLDAYKQVTTSAGQSYPAVNRAITDRINNGCLIFNYTGHGNESALAAERVITAEDINAYSNGSKLPLFITATCEFSRFDDVEQNFATLKYLPKQSGGELVLLNKNGGAIALMSTTRVVYSSPNFDLNKNIFKCAFRRDNDGKPYAFGDIIRIAKNNSGTGINKRNFTLLGDPALRISYPWHGRVVTDSINHTDATIITDTLKALSVISISGHIEKLNGEINENFNGVVSPIVFDKETRIRTLANDGGPVANFGMRNSILYSGRSKAVKGRFNFKFIVPRDINYNFGDGLINYYASDDSSDMNGDFRDIIVGGYSDSETTDNQGPDIKLFMNDTLFRSGGITNSDPDLLAILSDNSGINTTGSGIGHDLECYIDNNMSDIFVLNGYFETDINQYTKGSLKYRLSGLTPGKHSLTLKAWDYYNNSSIATIDFQVVENKKLVLENLISYPNPFSSSTNITLEHNMPGADMEILVNIFSADGRLIKTIKSSCIPDGYKLPSIEWDGTDDGGRRLGQGLVIFRVTVTIPGGQKGYLTGKMIIL